MRPAYLSAQDVEGRAEQVLADYERISGRPLTLPIPIERIIEKVLKLPILWEPIPSRNGRVIVSKLSQPAFGKPARITLNEDLLATTFCDCPGLERTALAHETGHAVFHLEHGRIQQMGLGLALDEPGIFTSMLAGLTDELGTALAARGPEGDDWWREWQAHTFMRFVLMPPRLLEPWLNGGGYRSWRGVGGLYDLRNRCDVTISTLVVHLSKLGYIRVDEHHVIHDATPAGRRQRALEL